MLNVNNRNLPGFRKCSEFVKILCQCVPAGTSAPVPAPSAHAARRLRTCSYLHLRRWQVPHAEKRQQRERLRHRHILFLGTLQVTPGGAGQFCSVQSVHLRNCGSSRLSLTQAREADASSVRPPCSERPGHPGPLSVAAPSWHACAVVRTVRGQSDRSTAERTPHTDSSVDSSKGLMYSKPSNSDWSILLMTSLWAQQRAPLLVGPRPLPPSPLHTGAGGPQGLLVVGGQLHRLAGELRVKVVQPVVVGDLRLERGQRLLLLQLRRQRTRQARQPASCPLVASVPAHSDHTHQKVLTFTHASLTRQEGPSPQTPTGPHPGAT